MKRVSSGAEVPAVMTRAETASVIVDSTMKVPRERSGSSFGAVGISLPARDDEIEPQQEEAADAAAISQPEIPRSTKLCTEKSASTPERVRKVP